MSKIAFRLICVVATIAVTGSLSAQPLKDINYRYQYDPAEPFFFRFKNTHQADKRRVLFMLTVRDSSKGMNDYDVEFELRDNLNAKEGQSIGTDIEKRVQANLITGIVTLPIDENRILVARVIQKSLRKAWYYFSVLRRGQDSEGFVMQNGIPITSNYLMTEQPVYVASDSNRIVSFYNDEFPAALPPFSESQGRVSKAIEADSIFLISGMFTPSRKGLYLLQSDTSRATGLAFRAEDDYPKFSTIPNIAGPFVYISTKQEYDKMIAAKADKKAFDKIVLSITNDKERAKTIMRNYFRRVYAANELFTSYKEGWKTDRGMIYIVFGLPDEVVLEENREIWNYSSDFFRATFTFTRTSSLFDPDNFILARDRKYQQTWYEVIEGWRNARY